MSQTSDQYPQLTRSAHAACAQTVTILRPRPLNGLRSSSRKLHAGPEHITAGTRRDGDMGRGVIITFRFARAWC